EQRIVDAVTPAERSPETEWLAVIHYELGRAELARGRPAAGLVHLRNAVRTDRTFLPAALALGDAYEGAGDRREAVRVWERAAEVQPALPLLARLERAFREDGRPTRMIALYRQALEKAPDEVALAVALGRVFFELEMLDEAADQFEKVEVRAPAFPRLATAALDLVFPALCAVCEARLGPRRRDPLCGPCWDAIDRIAPPFCDRCGGPCATPGSAMGGLDERGWGMGSSDVGSPERGPVSHPLTCARCAAEPPPYDYARSAAVYAGVMREAVHRFKFGGRRALARPLAELMVEQCGTSLPDGIAAIVPVPLAEIGRAHV